jgi:hypothetical protein
VNYFERHFMCGSVCANGAGSGLKARHVIARAGAQRRPG